MSRAVEKYYTVAEAALLLSVSGKTILRRIASREFGERVVDLARSPGNLEPKSHDYRIPASGINEHLEARRVFVSEPGVFARNEGELRRKVACPDARTEGPHRD